MHLLQLDLFIKLTALFVTFVILYNFRTGSLFIGGIVTFGKSNNGCHVW